MLKKTFKINFWFIIRLLEFMKFLWQLKNIKKYDGFVALGCVVKGKNLTLILYALLFLIQF